MNENFTDIVDEVIENGYAKIENFISKQEAFELEKQTTKAFKKAKKDFYHIETEFTKVLSINEESSQKIKYFQYLNKFFVNKNIINFVQNYFNSDEIEISKIFLAESSNSGEEVNVLPYKMHFDKTRYLKFMIYLRDVENRDGGVTFAKKEWNTKLQEELLSKQSLQEENVVEINDMSVVEEITGPAGTVAIFDTNITHKAGQVLSEKKRLVLRIDTRLKTNV